MDRKAQMSCCKCCPLRWATGYEPKADSSQWVQEASTEIWIVLERKAARMNIMEESGRDYSIWFPERLEFWHPNSKHWLGKQGRCEWGLGQLLEPGGWDPRGYKTTGPKERTCVVGIWTIPMRVLWLAEWKHNLSMIVASAHQICELHEIC